MIDLLFVVVLGGIMHATRSFSAGSGAPVGTSLGFGYLLLTGFLAGRVFASVRLPKLTGYIVAGAVVGPTMLGLLDDGMVENLQIVNGTAVALIALTAGTELRFDFIRPLIRSIVWIAVVAVAAAATALAAAVFLMRPHLPFLATLGAAEAAAVAAVIGLILVAPSPAVVVALREELRADGRVTRVVLGAVVLANLAVIVLFPIASACAKLVGGAGADISAMLRQIAWELAGSLLAGLVVALLITAHLRFVRRGATLFVLTAAFVVAEVGRRLGLDPLLVSLAAGLAIRNATSFGDVLHERIGASSLPIYVTFFAVTGATLHVDHLAPVAVPAVVLIAIRAAALVAAARAGARIAGAPAEVERWVPLGLLPQAGLALALTLLFVRTFDEIGAAASSLLLGIVALNEIFAPAIYRWALIRSGDAGRETGRDTSPSAVEPAVEARPPSP